MWNNKDCLLLQSSEYKRFTAEFHFGRIFFLFFEYVLYDCIPKDCGFGLKIS